MITPMVSKRQPLLDQASQAPAADKLGARLRRWVGPKSLRAIKRVRQSLKPNSSRTHLDAFVRRAAASLPAGSRILDAGAGDSLYRHHFTHVIYESADFLQSNRAYAVVDYVCTLDSVPVEDDRFDLVLLTQVLEHVPEPHDVLTEMHRVLRPGACIWLSAPLFYPEHETPHDFYRYTQYGFRHQLTRAGFHVELLEWMEGYHGTLAYQLDMASRCAAYLPRHYGGGVFGAAAAGAVLCARPLFFGLSLLLMRTDVRTRFTGGGHPKNYVIVARKVEDKDHT